MVYSTLYKHSVKLRETPKGRNIVSIRAVTPRSKNVSPPPAQNMPLSGWTTASARDWKDTGGMATEAVNPDGSSRSRLDQLGRQVHLSGWPTATCADINRSRTKNAKAYSLKLMERSQPGSNLATTAQAFCADKPARLTVSGEMLTGSSAGTVSGGQLNPDLPRWLMGYPEVLQACLPGYRDWQNWQDLMRQASNEPKHSEN